MPSTSTLQPAARHSTASRNRGSGQLRWAQLRSAQLRSVQLRPLHLGPGGLAQRRAQLEARWRDKLERVTTLSVAYHDAAACLPAGLQRNRGALSRRARKLARQAVAERQALAEIEAALDRIAAGRYGWCEQCARPIAAALLTAQPQARYCAACGRPAGRRISYAG